MYYNKTIAVYENEMGLWTAGSDGLLFLNTLIEGSGKSSKIYWKLLKDVFKVKSNVEIHMYHRSRLLTNYMEIYNFFITILIKLKLSTIILCQFHVYLVINLCYPNFPYCVIMYLIQ